MIRALTTTTLLLLLLFEYEAASTKEKTVGSDNNINNNAPRRERNLDHWDVDTLRVHLGLDSNGKPLPSSTTSTSSSSSLSAAVVDRYIGHDAAILFYASWCPNCHALAPTWDAIATHMKAGTKQSNLIMALFDCELNARHMALCTAAKIRHYPTVMYIGHGPYRDDINPILKFLLRRSDDSEKAIHKIVGPAGISPVSRSIKFQGNWQYGEQVMDWLVFMRFLSSWHRQSSTKKGWIKFIRDRVLSFLTFGITQNKANGGIDDDDDSALPIGVPPSMLLSSSSSSSSSTTGDVKRGSSSGVGDPTLVEFEEIQKKLSTTKKDRDELQSTVTHASYIIDALLFPFTTTTPSEEKTEEDASNHTTNDTTASFSNDNNNNNGTSSSSSSSSSPFDDVFEIMHLIEGWDVKEEDISAKTTTSEEGDKSLTIRAFRSCLIDLSLDYCTRLSTISTNAYLDELTSLSDDTPYPSLIEMEMTLQEMIATKEPYCGIFDECLKHDFATESLVECRPKQCPFKDDVGCRYVAACMDTRIQEEYAKALLETMSSSNSGKGTMTGGEKEGGDKKGWGIV